MYSFIRVGAGRPITHLSDCIKNANEIVKLINTAANQSVKILVFPELSITGYTCGDLFFQETLLKNAEAAISMILDKTKALDIFVTVGAPIRIGNELYNCAVSILRGKILGITPKQFLPNYNEFYEKRWFSSYKGDDIYINYCDQENIPFSNNLIFESKKFKDLSIGIEICEDLWAVIPPSSYHSLNGATVILNLSASNELTSKAEYRKSLVMNQSSKTYTTYCYSNCGYGESTTDLVFSGHSMICEKGNLLVESKKFERNSDLIYADTDIEMLVKERTRLNTFGENRNLDFHKPLKVKFDLKFNEGYEPQLNIDKLPFVPTDNNILSERCEEIFNIQISGLSKRIETINSKKAVIGISGGLDSTLALLVTVKTFDYLGKSRKDILGITMPGFGTTDKTYQNALDLMDSLGIETREINITKASLQHFEDINHDPLVHDVTYENTQARERTQILMDIANMENGIVIGTGDLSELALGFATYNGDHMSMYAVNSGVPKTLIKSLVNWVSKNSKEKTSKVLKDILDTPISPELLPPKETGEIDQKTEDIVGPYELHDFFLYYVLRFGFEPKKILFLAEKAFKEKYSKDELLKWLKLFYRRFFTQQFKRSCMPDGPKVGSVALSPRGDLKMPSDALFDMWIL